MTLCAPSPSAAWFKLTKEGGVKKKVGEGVQSDTVQGMSKIDDIRHVSFLHAPYIGSCESFTGSSEGARSNATL